MNHRRDRRAGKAQTAWETMCALAVVSPEGNVLVRAPGWLGAWAREFSAVLSFGLLPSTQEESLRDPAPTWYFCNPVSSAASLPSSHTPQKGAEGKTMGSGVTQAQRGPSAPGEPTRMAPATTSSCLFPSHAPCPKAKPKPLSIHLCWPSGAQEGKGDRRVLKLLGVT